MTSFWMSLVAWVLLLLLWKRDSVRLYRMYDRRRREARILLRTAQILADRPDSSVGFWPAYEQARFELEGPR